MKKIFLTFVAMLFMVVANAQSWSEAVNEYVTGMNESAPLLEQVFKQSGLNVKVSTSYNEATKELVSEVKFEPHVWNAMGNANIKAAKTEQLNSYRTSFKTDAEFSDFVRKMKQNGAKFLTIYSCVENGKNKTKNFVITPDEIMK